MPNSEKTRYVDPSPISKSPCILAHFPTHSSTSTHYNHVRLQLPAGFSFLKEGREVHVHTAIVVTCS